MSDPVPSSAIYDATTGGLSVIVITGGSTGDVLTKQSDGTYAPATPSSGSPGGSSGQVQYNNAGAFNGAAAIAYASTVVHVAITSQGAAIIPLCVKGAASQTANIQEWQNSSGTVLGYFSLSNGGQFLTGSTTLFKASGSNFAVIGYLGGAAFEFYRYANTGWKFVGAYVGSYTQTCMYIDTAAARKQGLNTDSPNAHWDIVGVVSTTVGLRVRGASSQSAALAEFLDSSGTVLAGVRANGAIKPASLANSAAANDSIYYSTDAAKLVYKDSSGTVNNLY